MEHRAPRLPRIEQPSDSVTGPELKSGRLLYHAFDDQAGTINLAIHAIHEGWQQPYPGAE